MIQMPPGSAKSTYASILLPAWWYTQHPRDSIIAACHTSGLARYFGRRARSVVVEEQSLLGYAIISEDRSSGHWSTTGGGEYYAAGVRGTIIGRRADLAIIDDPVKSQMEVESSTQRDRIWEWYRADLLPRLKPSARIILVMTRWHPDDLCGRLLQEEAPQWQNLSLSALSLEADQVRRTPGETLWPAWENIDVVSRKRDTTGHRVWSAQFQQTPTPPGEKLFKVDLIDFIDCLPLEPPGQMVRAWDLAAATPDRGDPDWTVGVKLLRRDNGHYVVLDVVRMRGSARQVEETIVSTARMDGYAVPIGLPEDPGQAGKSQVAYMTSALSGFNIVASPETGSKLVRATPVSAQIEGKNFALLRAAWNHPFLEEMREFPHGRKDDQVDALSRAFSMTLKLSRPARQVQVSHFAR